MPDIQPASPALTALRGGLIAALIAVVCIGTWTLIGPALNTKFLAVYNGLK